MEAPGDNRADALVQQGLAASRSGDAPTAVRLFREASAAQPDSAVPHFLLGAELAQSGDVGAAEAAYANAVLLAPGFDMARFQLGLLQFTSGRVAIALVTWSPLLDRPVDQPLQRFVSGFGALAIDDFAMALDCFRDGLQRADSNEPLKADIRMVVARIEPLAAAQRSSSLPKVEAEQPETNEMHVLLSNYERQGRIH